MAAPTIFRSTDTNAPILTASPASVIALLRACLVDGVGSVKASATVTVGTTVSNNDTITIDGVTYTWKTALTPAAGEVLIGASPATNLSNLAAAIGQWGTAGTNYGAGTTLQAQVQVTALTATVLTLTALKGGTAGNSIAISKSAAQITLSGATLSGGSGADSGGLSWTRPYTSTTGATAAIGAAFKAPAGSGMYCQVLDNASGTGLSRDALCYGFETMSAYNTGTGQFPTTAQVATVGAVLRKCGATADSTNKVWMLIGDDRTFYLFVQSGDSAGVWIGFAFGDFYSYVASDAYKCHIQGFNASQTTARSTDPFGTLVYGFVTAQSLPNSYVPRNYSGVGASTAFVQIGDSGMIPVSAAANQNAVGNLGFPNPADGGLYLAPFRLMDGGTPGTTVAGTLNFRGKERGVYHCCHATSFYADGDTVNGTGAYAGRSFLCVKPVMGNSIASMVWVETTAWDTSS